MVRSETGETFNGAFLDDNPQAQYQEEARWLRILGFSAGFVVLISCLGLLGQAALAVARRTKEIGRCSATI